MTWMQLLLWCCNASFVMAAKCIWQQLLRLHKHQLLHSFVESASFDLACAHLRCAAECVSTLQPMSHGAHLTFCSSIQQHSSPSSLSMICNYHATKFLLRAAACATCLSTTYDILVLSKQVYACLDCAGLAKFSTLS